MATFVVRSTYIAAEEERRLAARPAHRAWLASLRSQGVLVNAGPLADGSGALLVFELPDRAELAETLAQDPYPADTITSAVLGEWRPLFDW